MYKSEKGSSLQTYSGRISQGGEVDFPLPLGTDDDVVRVAVDPAVERGPCLCEGFVGLTEHVVDFLEDLAVLRVVTDAVRQGLGSLVGLVHDVPPMYLVVTLFRGITFPIIWQKPAK